MTILTDDFAIDCCGADHRSDAAEQTNSRSHMPEDVRLYLRHVEGGETIRSLARETGCHPSTILRRIRRFEARRDDPLIDRALTVSSTTGPAFDERQALRVLRRLAEPGAVMATTETMEKAIVTRNEIRTAVLDRKLAEAMALKGWVVQAPGTGRIQRYAIAPAGREALRARLRTNRSGKPMPHAFSNATPITQDGLDPPNPHADQHRSWDKKVLEDPETGRRRGMRINIAESPLLLLARRRDPNGEAFLTIGMVAAGERLREDFELAQMGPRVTQNWDGFMTAGIDVSRSGSGYRGGSESARDRVAAALRELGPGMGDIVLRVCCFLEGVEMTERRLGWSARSGKVVLKLALMRLERHYQETYGSGSRLIG